MGNVIENITLAKDVIKSAIELAQKSNDAPLLEKLYEARSLILDFQEENQQLKQTIKELQQLKTTKDSLTFKKNSYWKKESPSGESGPYCSSCLDGKDKLIRLTQINRTYYECHNCSNKLDLEPNSHGDFPEFAITD